MSEIDLGGGMDCSDSLPTQSRYQARALQT
jgi:hypothetical protein